MPRNWISVVIKTENNQDTIEDLIYHLHVTLLDVDLAYEVVVVDDNSTDRTIAILHDLAKHYPILVTRNTRKEGRTQAFMKGCQLTHGQTICLVDAGLQYPPEAIVPMLETMNESGAAVVFAPVGYPAGGLVAGMLAKLTRLIFCRALLGMNFDLHTGLMVCNRRLLRSVNTRKYRPWSFDLELIIRARLRGLEAVDFPIASNNNSLQKTGNYSALLELIKTSVRIKRDLLRKGIGRKSLNAR